MTVQHRRPESPTASGYRRAPRRDLLPIGPLLYGLLFFLFGYTAVLADSPEKLSNQTLADTVIILDNAMMAISQPAGDYRKILQPALATLPHDSPASVKLAITNFLGRAPAVGPDFKCSTDFLRYIARRELLRLKDELLGISARPPEPQVCYVAPFTVDVTLPTDTVEIYGYDLDQVPLEMFLVDRDDFHDVSFALIRRTHYHLTLNLGSNGVTFSPSSHTLGLTWGHLIHHSIPLIQPATRLCESRIEEIAANKAMIYAPPAISGDTVVSGPGLRVWANFTLDHESDKVDAIFCITATGQHGHRIMFSGCGSEYVYTSESGRVIEGVFGALGSDITYLHRNQAEEVKEGAHGGPVRQWTFRGFGGQFPARTEPQVTARLTKIRVVSTEADGCVSPIAYSEAKRTKRLSRRTIQRLDSELERIDPEILKLRPRFAPPAY